jgi:hypothetical protein
MCETELDECGSKPYQNGGDCIDFVATYWCHCKAGFSGYECEESCACRDDRPLNHYNGTCEGAVNDVYSFPHFSCNTGYEPRGQRVCNSAGSFVGGECVKTNECRSHPCANGGIRDDKDVGYRCFCAPSFTGNNCQEHEATTSCWETDNNCDVTSTFCYPIGPGMHECKCNAGYAKEEGSNITCHVDNQCDADPCQNGGVYTEKAFGNFECSCVAAWTGNACDIDGCDNRCDEDSEYCDGASHSPSVYEYQYRKWQICKAHKKSSGRTDTQCGRHCFVCLGRVLFFYGPPDLGVEENPPNPPRGGRGWKTFYSGNQVI